MGIAQSPHDEAAAVVAAPHGAAEPYTLEALSRLYESERAARIAAEQRLAAIDRERRMAVHSAAVRDYVMAGAHCLLWYADIHETSSKYLDWKMEFPNAESARRFLPIEIKPGETIDEAWYWRRHAADRDACDVIGTEAIRAGKGYQQDFRCYCEDGSMRWLHEDVCVETVVEGKHWRAVGVCTDTTAQHQLQARMQATNNRLKSAIAETHHRVKNNFQVVAALVDLQRDEAGQPPETRTAIQRMGQHIRALAAMHDLLTIEAQAGSDLDSVPVRPVLERLIDLVRQTYGHRAISAQVAEVRLPARKATALVVLVNELVSNALKHSHGSVAVALSVRNGFFCLEVTDDGPGFPEGFDPLTTGTNGLEIAESIAHLDLETSLKYATLDEGGARVSLEFLPGTA